MNDSDSPFEMPEMEPAEPDFPEWGIVLILLGVASAFVAVFVAVAW